MAGMAVGNVVFARHTLQEGIDMLRLALFFLIVALIAGALGLYPVAAIGSQIAWICFVVFLVLFLVSMVLGGIRSGPPI
jgi:uncharacterized membrane protein YtjA (UPF0391 family)